MECPEGVAYGAEQQHDFPVVGACLGADGSPRVGLDRLVELAGILARLGVDVGGHRLLLLRPVALVVGVERGGEGLVEPLLVGEQLCTGGEQPPPHPLPLGAERRGVDGAEQLQGAVGRRFEHSVRGPELRLGGPLSAAAGEAEQHQGQQQVCERSFHGRMYGTLLIGGAVRDARGATS